MREFVKRLERTAQKKKGEKNPMAEKVKVRSDCIYASNPFHECSQYCSRKMAERKMQKDKKNAGSFGRKEMGSRPKPPISTFGPSKVHSSTSHVSPKKKTESRNGGGSIIISSAKPYSEENGVKDVYLSNEQPESSQIFLPPETLITQANQKDSPKTKKGEEKLKKLTQADAIGESPVVSAIGSSFSLSGIDHTLEDEDEEEVESVTSESCVVSVGKYRVKASFSSILQSIFDKYGDIATTCKLESQAIRSYYLECVCYVVQELKCTPFEKLSKAKIKQLTAILKDVESSEINVSWLRGTVDEIAEAFELSNQHRLMEDEKLNYDLDMESLQRDLEAQMEDLKTKEKEISNAKERVEETRTRLSQLEQKCWQLNEIILSIQSKTDLVFDPDALVSLS